MERQMTIFDFMQTDGNHTETSEWKLLEPQKGKYCFPKCTKLWRKIECKVYYPQVNKETIETYEYKDHTFRSMERWNPEMGLGRVVAWKEIEPDSAENVR